jgi:uncharacterized membrane protein required for colicin V production
LVLAEEVAVSNMALALTIALAVTIAVPALVGYWRDPRRGLFALAGTLLGATLAGFWAAPWGRAFAEAFDGSEATMTLFISLALLLGGALVIGYGAGVLLPPPGKTAFPRRLLGVLLGLLNGVLLAGYTLRYAAESSAGFAEELIGIPLAEYIIAGLPLLFLGLALALAAVILARRALQLMRRPKPAPAPDPVQPAAPAPTPAGKEAQRKAAEKIEERINRGA